MRNRLIALPLFWSLLACGSRLPKNPAQGFLYFEDTEAVVHEYEVTEAEFNGYSDEDGHWLTIFIRAEKKVSPDDGDNQMPWLEINLPASSDQEATLKSGMMFTAPAHDDSLGSLTDFYHWSHADLEPAHVEVQNCLDDRCEVEISANTRHGPIIVRAVLVRNPERRRSIK